MDDIIEVGGSAVGIRNDLNALAVNNTFGPLRCGTIGDSLNAGNDTKNSNSQGNWSWYNPIQIMSGGKIVCAINRGIPGNTSTAIVKRLADEVLVMSGLDAVMIMQGTNDLNPGNSISTTTSEKNDIQSIRAIRAAGLIPIVLPIPPSNSYAAAAVTMNARKAVTCAAEGAIFADGIWVDSANSDYTWITGRDQADGTHPTPVAARDMAIRFNTHPAILKITSSRSDSFQILPDDLLSRVPNADFSASSGGLATGWSFYANSGSIAGVTPSIEVDAVRGVNMQKFTFTSSTFLASFDSATIDISMLAGRRVAFIGKLKTTGFDNTGSWVSVFLRGTDAVEGTNFNPNPAYQIPYDVDGYFYGEAEVPASSSTAVVRVQVNSVSGGAGSVSVDTFLIRPIGGAELGATRSNRVRNGKVQTKTAAYTMTVDDDLVMVDATAGPVTITLPSAGNSLYGFGTYTSSYQIPIPGQGLEYTIVKTDVSGNAVTVSAPSAHTIEGSATVTLSSQYSKAKVKAAKTGLFLRLV